jgi:hypothetical protein
MLSKTIPAVTIALLTFTTSHALVVEGAAPRTGKKYHFKSCHFAKKTPKSHIICFTSSKEAKEYGFATCKVCKPPGIRGQLNHIRTSKVNMEPIPEHDDNLVGSTKVHARAVYVLARFSN